MKFNTHKTAIKRRGISPLASAVLCTCYSQGLHHQAWRTVLDYGCGYGQDLKYYKEAGLKAYGYDPHEEFGFPMPKRKEKYDVVVLNYVLNVIPHEAEIKKIISHVTRLEGLEDVRVLIPLLCT